MQPVQEEYDTSIEAMEYERRQRAEATLWTVLARLYRRRRLIAIVTGIAAVAAVVISLLLPNWYRASAKVLIPESQGTLLTSAILNDLPAAASALIGGSSAGDYTRYRAILTSRNMMKAAVDSFNLVRVYDVGDSDTPIDDAIEALESNTDFEIDIEYHFLSISVLDKDPERSAAMANFFVRRLNATNKRLTTEGAGNYRRSIEARYNEALAAMDSVLNATQRFQQEHGVYDLPTQAQTFFEQVGALRQSALEAEIKVEALRAQYGADNAQVQAMQSVVVAANRKYQAALAGGEILLPVPQSEVPTVAREFVDLELERTIQRTILEVLGPLYEQARFQEEREMQAVQVLDEAVAPAEKAKPKRSIICVIATLSAFLLAVLFVLAHEWWRQNHERVLRRLQRAAAES